MFLFVYEFGSYWQNSIDNMNYNLKKGLSYYLYLGLGLDLGLYLNLGFGQGLYLDLWKDLD